ncbi:MAG: alpha-L-rhamnosidase C-terminal domain-containing protein [Planctomycetota bacterium]
MPTDVPLTDWNAAWIWTAEAGPANTWLCARTTWDLPSVPTEAHVRIAADSKYWLWVNGVLVVREGALKRGPTPDDTWCDEVDLAPHLRAGANTIAVLVWYWGKHGFSHKDSGHGGLLVQGPAGLRSGRHWKVRVHPAFGITGLPHPNMRLSEFNVRFDARLDDSAWFAPTYDDRTWDAATEHGTAPCAPWGKLFPRQIPLWRDGNPQVFVNANDLPTISTGKDIVGNLPSNLHVTVVIDVEAAPGQLIDIRADHYFGGGGVTDSNVRAEYITRAGRQQWECPAWINGHRIEFRMPAGIVVHGLQWRETGYDCNFAGSFTCDDPFLETLWNKARRTLYVTMRDTYFDCPDRERAQWWGDVVVELGETFYCLDRRADLLSRKAILDLVRWQRADHTLYAPVPAGSWHKELPPQMLTAVSRYGFSHYVLGSGDASIATTAYPAVKRYLSIWNHDDRGLVVHRSGGWDWGDWGEHVDLPLIDNGWLYLALDGAIHLAELAGAHADVAGYRARQDRITAGVRAHLWDNEGYRSPGAKHYDDRGNALMILTGIATADQHAAITSVLMNSRFASPYMEKYVLEALFSLGHDHLALQRMHERYSTMVADWRTTLYEFWSLDNPWSTANHAWAGGPLTLLSQFVAGVAPLEPGFRRFAVRPQPGDLRRVAASVPAAVGEIAVRFERSDSELTLEVNVPPGATAVAELPSSCGKLSDQRHNGIPCVATVELTAGSHRLTAHCG